MKSNIPGFECDIFVSYRQNDNRSGWVTHFVEHLNAELAAAIKHPVSVYFDSSPESGLLDTHHVDKSLEGKLKALILIPILSQTYCDPRSFAWQHEFQTFNRLTKEDRFGRDIRLRSGNVASRILPIRIHDLDADDKATLEQEIGGPLRAIDFTYKAAGINRPLVPEDDRTEGLKVHYRDLINRTANSVKEILDALNAETPADASSEPPTKPIQSTAFKHRVKPTGAARTLVYFAVFFITAVIATVLYFGFLKKASAKAASDDRSVAVVPFDNLSKDPSQDYMSDGVMETILSHLNKIQGLRLPSRTTMMTYKGTKKTIRQIASELGVRFVLEGSVLRVGNTVRINAQLIDGDTDEHVWSEYYDRNASDLLNIQSEVAQQIASNLKVQIQPLAKASIEARPTENQEAYDLYLKARQLKSYDSFDAHQELLERAIKLDSNFADAYAQLAWHWMVMGTSKMTARQVLQRAEPLLNKSLSIDPNNAETHALLGFLNCWYKWDLYAANREFEQAAQLAPSNPFVMSADAKVASGQFGEAVKICGDRIKAEPKNIHNKINLAFALAFAGKREEALHWLDSAKNFASPDDPSYNDLGRTYFYLGQYERVLEVNKKRTMLNFETRMKAVSAMSLIRLGRQEEGLEILKELVESSKQTYVGSPSYHVAMIYADLGDADKAFQFLGQAHEKHEIEFYWCAVEPPFEFLQKDIRWKKVMSWAVFPSQPVE